MLITSVSNPRVKAWHALAREAPARRAAGAAWVEGERFIETALRAGAVVRTLVHLPGVSLAALGAHAKTLRQVETFEMSENVMRRCASTASPPPVAAVISVPTSPVGVPQEGRYAILCGLQDPGNVGAIVRSAHGAGWRGVVLTGACADPWSPKALRASAGSAFFVEVRDGDAETLNAWKEKGARFLAADAKEGVTPPAAGFAGLAFGGVVIGSEAHGVPPEIASLCEGKVRIPLAGSCESLNAAQAATVLMFAAKS